MALPPRRVFERSNPSVLEQRFEVLTSGRRCGAESGTPASERMVPTGRQRRHELGLSPGGFGVERTRHDTRAFGVEEYQTPGASERSP